MREPLLNSEYNLVINWNPQDTSFDLTNGSHGVFGKRLGSWTLAYDAALAVIEKLNDPVVQRVLRRGLTPTPLTVLQASVIVSPCGELDYTGAAYSWQFLGSNEFNVVVDEVAGTFKGIHDNR